MDLSIERRSLSRFLRRLSAMRFFEGCPSSFLLFFLLIVSPPPPQYPTLKLLLWSDSTNGDGYDDWLMKLSSWEVGSITWGEEEEESIISCNTSRKGSSNVEAVEEINGGDEDEGGGSGGVWWRSNGGGWEIRFIKEDEYRSVFSSSSSLLKQR